MRPDERDLDDEIRGHLALSIQDRVDRGEDPRIARQAALEELGYRPALRASMRRVWYSGAADAAGALGQEMRIALRGLARAPGLAAAVVVTLALGISANAAVFSVVRAVLLRPLVNAAEDRLIYIRQSAPGLDAPNVTFSVPEVRELAGRTHTVAALGEFSTVEFTMLGLGEPRVVRAGVVNGAYFQVMGLRAVLGRLLGPDDDRPEAPGAAVLTHRFWVSALAGDPSIVGRSIQLGKRAATVVGVLEPSVPYPAETEIVANVVTSPHHLGALMVTERTHRMTELFGRLAPGASIESAREELAAAHAAMTAAHPDAYPSHAGYQVSVTPLREQVTAPARPILLLLLGTTAIVFVVACANVVNLILARSSRREGELAVRAALGATRGALRRTLLAESLLLCGAGAALGLLLASPLVRVLARFASMFTVRALDVRVDHTLVWTGAALAIVAAVLLAWIPRLPASGGTPHDLAAGTGRTSPAAARRLRGFAVAQIACSFVLLAAAAALASALAALHTAGRGHPEGGVLAVDIPPPATGVGGAQAVDLVQQALRRIEQIPGVESASAGMFVPWRDSGMPQLRFGAGNQTAEPATAPHARFRVVAPGYFGVLGIPLLAGREFTEEDDAASEPVVIVSRSVADRLFPGGDALSRTFVWVDSLMGLSSTPRRIVGIVADMEDEHLLPRPALTVYQPMQQMGYADRLFVRTAGSNPYDVVPAVIRTVRDIAPTQAVERAMTLEDVRRNILAPERLNTLLVGAFAGLALVIAAVGVAGVLSFGVKTRTHEFGVRQAMGSTPAHLLRSVLADGVAIASAGILAGSVAGYVLAGIAARHVDELRSPGPLPLLAAAAVLAAAALMAAAVPAARAARVDVVRALRTD